MQRGVELSVLNLPASCYGYKSAKTEKVFNCFPYLQESADRAEVVYCGGIERQTIQTDQVI